VVITEELLTSIEIAIQDFCKYLNVEVPKDYFDLLMEKL
jgi:hypothetical protein